MIWRKILVLRFWWKTRFTILAKLRFCDFTKFTILTEKLDFVILAKKTILRKYFLKKILIEIKWQNFRNSNFLWLLGRLCPYNPNPLSNDLMIFCPFIIHADKWIHQNRPIYIWTWTINGTYLTALHSHNNKFIKKKTWNNLFR